MGSKICRTHGVAPEDTVQHYANGWKTASYETKQKIPTCHVTLGNKGTLYLGSEIFHKITRQINSILVPIIVWFNFCL